MEKDRTSSSLITYAGLKSIEVFKTNVAEEKEADRISSLLAQTFPRYAIHFDLEDCDRILRIEGDVIHNEHIISLLANQGYDCTVLV